MSWNYRVFKTRHVAGTIDEVSFDIREVHYDDDGVIESATYGGVAPVGLTVKELQSDITLMQVAFTKDVVTPKDIPGYEYDGFEVPLGEE